jgi:hypothetical protein
MAGKAAGESVISSNANIVRAKLLFILSMSLPPFRLLLPVTATVVTRRPPFRHHAIFRLGARGFTGFPRETGANSYFHALFAATAGRDGGNVARYAETAVLQRSAIA